MTPERWQHIQDVYFEAVKQQGEDRKVFVEQQCAGDLEMQREVVLLLECEDKVGDFLQDTAIKVLSDTQRHRIPDSSHSGDLIGHLIADRYAVTSFIGSGGMGTVYRADHQLLGLPVAIKRISSQFRHRREYRDRFLEEARKAAQLNHENITKVTDAVEESGEVFVVMEYVEGRTLRARLESPMTVDQILDVAIQCTSGLVAAHQKRIVHLDLKPENIMLTASNQVKICDFGVARQFPADDSGEEKPAGGRWTFAGTPAYMAPEVMASNQFDLRADFFSLGLVFYEMLARKHPFLDVDVKSTMNRIKDQPTPPLAQQTATKLPARLVELVEKLLSKNPADRPETADDILQELQRIKRRNSATAAAHAAVAQARRKPLKTGAIALAGALAISMLVWTAMKFIQKPIQVDNLTELAVLPFKNVGDDRANQAFCDGLVEMLISKLSQLDRFQNKFRVKAASEIQGITTAREAYRAFGVRLAVTGSVQRVGNSVHETISLIDAPTGTLIHGTTITTEVASLSTMQDNLVNEVAKLLLGAPLSNDARQVLSGGTTGAAVAYDFYVQGLGYLQHYENADSIDKATSFFDQALRLDEHYALAYAGRCEAYWRKYELIKEMKLADQGKENCQKALHINDRLAQVYVTLALISNGTGRYEDAVDQVRKSLEFNPVSGSAFVELARAYEKMGKFAPAEENFKYAIQVRTNDWGSYNNLGRFYFAQGRYPEAEVQFLQARDLAPDNFRVFNNLGAIYQATKRYDDAEKMFKKSIELRPSAQGYSNLGTFYYFQLKRPADAARMFEKAVDTNGRDYRAWRNLAAAYYWSPGEREKSRAAYLKTIELAEQELRVNRRDQTILMNLADSYAMIDAPGQALDYLRRANEAAQLENNSKLIAAGVYERLGQRALAMQWIAKALCSGYPRDSLDSDPAFVELRADPSFEAATSQTTTKTRNGEPQCH